MISDEASLIYLDNFLLCPVTLNKVSKTSTFGNSTDFSPPGRMVLPMVKQIPFPSKDKSKGASVMVGEGQAAGTEN